MIENKVTCKRKDQTSTLTKSEAKMSELSMVLQVVDIERRIQLESEKQNGLHPDTHLPYENSHEGYKNFLSIFSRAIKLNKSQVSSNSSSRPVSLYR